MQVVDFLERGNIELRPIALLQAGAVFVVDSSPEGIARQVRVQVRGGHDVMLGVPGQQPSRCRLQSQRSAQWLGQLHAALQCLRDQLAEHLRYILGLFEQHPVSLSSVCCFSAKWRSIKASA